MYAKRIEAAAYVVVFKTCFGFRVNFVFLPTFLTACLTGSDIHPRNSLRLKVKNEIALANEK